MFKVGQKVAITNFGRLEDIVKIERETKTLFILSNNKRFRKDTLNGSGSSYHLSIVEATDELREKLRKQKEENMLKQRHEDLWREFAFRKGNKWAEFSLEKLEEIEKILEDD